MSAAAAGDIEVEVTASQPASHENGATETETQPIKTQDPHPPAENATAPTAEPAAPAPPMSKNALKRLRKQQEWEDGRDDRRKRRKEKRHGRRERLREERAALLAQGADPTTLFPKKTPATLVPVALIIDCDFERYMTDKERVSLSSQVTRCYSDNRNAKYRAHLWMAGWAGKIEARFAGALGNQHGNWRGVGFEAGDFLAAAERAREGMRTAGGEMIAPLQRSRDDASLVAWDKDDAEPFPLPGPEPALDAAHRDVVYLTSESPYTLQRLEPHTSYVVGGLVDKNREKGLCYRRARARGIRTARLPIGRFMVMQSRQVLATNHVVEIMLRWLECEDWGEAFMAVIPKRKGGRLIGDEGGDEDDDDAAREAEGAKVRDEEDDDDAAREAEGAKVKDEDEDEDRVKEEAEPQ
ncbi:tRNA (guanine(9)-N1)-methyltransferase [Tolypocladium ophioglossoides CBS 100239]|uniref:tRNA (guanine(9)-N1)-methyltransferase n=1 Tax=Tolypocladium ophioglossoides (strain CBS 100239) TaxID=1163406 RepID=A0A0L0NGZ8_TOLOC|nr:tRNA (guanine(9)-N1)-methyltransferase [Tolypocladium ophioglossoides CBS 100239]